MLRPPTEYRGRTVTPLVHNTKNTFRTFGGSWLWLVRPPLKKFQWMSFKKEGYEIVPHATTTAVTYVLSLETHGVTGVVREKKVFLPQTTLPFSSLKQLSFGLPNDPLSHTFAVSPHNRFPAVFHRRRVTCRSTDPPNHPSQSRARRWMTSK